MKMLKITFLLAIFAFFSTTIEAQPQHMGIAKDRGSQNAVDVAIYNLTGIDTEAYAIKTSDPNSSMLKPGEDTYGSVYLSSAPEQNRFTVIENVKVGDTIRIQSYHRPHKPNKGRGFSSLDYTVTENDVDEVKKQYFGDGYGTGHSLRLLVTSPVNYPNIIYVTKATNVGFISSPK